MPWLSKLKRDSYQISKEKQANTNTIDYKESTKKGKKKKKILVKTDEKDVSIGGLFKYADKLDIFLMVLGTISALLSSGIYPLMFLMYGQVANVFVDFTKSKVTNVTTLLSNKTNSCFKLSESNTDFNSRLTFAIVFYVITGVVSVILCYISNVTWNTAAERQIRRIRNLLFKSIIRQEMSFFDKTTPGDLNSKITGNVNTLQQALGFKFSDSLSMLGRGVACLILAMVTAWKFSIVFLGLAPILILCTSLMVMMIKKYTIKEFKAYGNAGRISQEVLSAIRTVNALNIQEIEMKNYESNLHEAERMSIKKGAITGFFGGLSSFMFNSLFAIGIYYGVYLVRTECSSYDPGKIMQSFFSMITTTFALGQALPFLRDLAEARGAAKSVFHVIEKKSKIDVFDDVNNPPHNDNPLELDGNIKFENVHFSYPTRQDAKILRGLTFEIEKGKTIALCGSSGGGKSTVIQLLQRYYEPLDGKILINNREIQNININKLRSQMALVSQEPILFATSIKENIRLGRLNASDVEIEEAAKLANAHDFILKLNDKYDTLVGERGSQLSGGQKQRIAIARALIRQPKILLLDEATSALDLQSERVVQDALDRAKIGRTTIIVAHRLSTIRNADLIIALNNGQVAEMGTHDELMSHGGIYYDLVMKQTKDPKNEIAPLDQDDVKIDDEPIKEDFKKDSYEMLDVDMDEKSKKKRMRPFKLDLWLWRFHSPETFFIIFGCLCQIVQGATMPVVALLFSEIYKIFANPDPIEQENQSLFYLGILFAIAVASLITQIGNSLAFSVTGARMVRRLRVKMFTSMLKQDISWHDQDENRSSVLATRLSASAALAKGLTSDKLNLIVQGLSGVGVAVIVALVLNWKLALVIMAFIPLSFIGGMLAAKSTLNTNVKGKSTVEDAGRITTECVENIKTVVALGRELYFIDEFQKLFKRKWKRQLCMLHFQGIAYGVTNSMLFFIQATAFGYGYILIRDEGLEVPNLYRIYAAVTFSSMILGRVFSQLPDANKATDAAKAAYKIIKHVPKIDALSEQGLKPNKFNGSIKFDNVHFKYPTRNNKILNGLTLEINANETTALVGESGCGKSTTIQLLLRFYDCTKGSILIDGVNIKDLNIKWLREQIGLVSQEPILFNTTIRKNIEYGDVNNGSIQFDEVVRVSKEANIHFKIENLPQKYDTLVGTKGGQLSGGEKQRVAIARALIRKPKILLLDEATSALDTQSEELVQDALDRAQQGRTCVSIAHRLSTIQNSPKISVFKDGRIAEEGTHAQLMANKSIYYTLQMKSANR